MPLLAAMNDERREYPPEPMYIEPPDIDSLLDVDDFEPPSADPKIQLEYEASLGAFVVAYNMLDDLVAKVLGYALSLIDRAELGHLPHNFAGRVDLLDLLGGVKVMRLETINYKELRDINKMRNFLVHGFFDQNPFDGSYSVSNKSRKEHVKAETIRGWARRATEAWSALRGPETMYVFRDSIAQSGDESAKA